MFEAGVVLVEFFGVEVIGVLVLLDALLVPRFHIVKKLLNEFEVERTVFLAFVHELLSVDVRK